MATIDDQGNIHHVAAWTPRTSPARPRTTSKPFFSALSSWDWLLSVVSNKKLALFVCVTTFQSFGSKTPPPMVIALTGP
jgi:hypothetical protein